MTHLLGERFTLTMHDPGIGHSEVSGRGREPRDAAADLDRLIAQTEKNLAALERGRAGLLKCLTALREQRSAAASTAKRVPVAPVHPFPD